MKTAIKTKDVRNKGLNLKRLKFNNNLCTPMEAVLNLYSFQCFKSDEYNLLYICLDKSNCSWTFSLYLNLEYKDFPQDKQPHLVA